MAEGTRDRIMALLGAGATQGQAAAAIGVEESWVSQLMAEEGFRAEVEKLRGDAAAGKLQNDQRIDSIEEKAWTKVENLLPIQTDVMKVLKIAQAANAAKRVSTGVTSPQSNNPVVPITLPVVVAVEFKMTPDRQVVEVDSRPLQTMASHTVQALLSERRAQKLLTDVTPQVSAKTQGLLNEF